MRSQFYFSQWIDWPRWCVYVAVDSWTGEITIPALALELVAKLATADVNCCCRMTKERGEKLSPGPIYLRPKRKHTYFLF